MFLIALLSCQGLGVAGSTPTPPAVTPMTTIPEAKPVATREPVRMPAGAVVTRECFGVRDERVSRSSAGPRPAPPVAPAARPASSAAPVVGGVASSASSGAAPAKAKSEAGRGDAPAAAPAADALAPTGAAFGYAEPEAPAEPVSQAKRALDKDEARSMTVAPPPPRAEPNLDWGATVYLSNDDSMSLASAQRLLWAVQNRGPVRTSEVRPHELLNYFSFDTAPVPAGDTFSVLASAEQTAADTLTLAFAVKGATPERKPLDLTLVLDRSGSMSAEGRMTYLQRGLRTMVDQLRPGDRVDLVLFDHEVCSPLENFVVGRDDPGLLGSTIDRLQPRGSTDLDAGLREGYRIALGRTGEDVRGRNRRMMLISDALLNTGDVDPDTVSEVGRAYDQAGVRLTAIGVGREFNDAVLDRLTEKGKGAYVYLGSEAVVDRVFGVGFESLTRTIAHDVHFALDLPPSLAMRRFYGEEASTEKADVQPIHYYSGTTQLFLQDLTLRDARPVASDPVTLTVEYTDADTGRAEKQVFTSTVGQLLRADGHNLQKGRALVAWTDLILARSLGSSPCGAPFATWQERVAAVGEDAELAWLDGLTSPLCGREPVAVRPPAVRTAALKVKVDSDQPIPEVTLTCGGWHHDEPLGGSDSVARFDARPGACTLTLHGTVPMSAAVQVPETGADLRCVVRGGRLSCG